MRVVIAEDDALLREGLLLLLRSAGHEVAAVAGSGPEVLPALLEHRPDVAVLDVRMPPGFRDEGGLGVEGRAAGGDPLQRVQELVHPARRDPGQPARQDGEFRRAVRPVLAPGSARPAEHARLTAVEGRSTPLIGAELLLCVRRPAIGSGVFSEFRVPLPSPGWPPRRVPR